MSREPAPTWGRTLQQEGRPSGLFGGRPSVWELCPGEAPSVSQQSICGTV